MDIFLVVLLLIVGIVLLIAEIFFLPGFGFAGICGIGCFIGSVTLAYIRLTPLFAYAGHITLGACILFTCITIYIFLKSNALKKMSLDTKIESKVNLAKPGKKINDLEKAAQDIYEKENNQA